MSNIKGQLFLESSKIYVLYHGNCTDGTGAKFAAWKKYGKNAEYIAVNYGQPVPELIPGAEVYIVDFAYPKEVLEQLQCDHKSVVVRDHHQTAQGWLEGVKGCHFDMTKSGCVLAWEYFHPDKPVPELLLDIQDRDLWQFKRPNSKAVQAGLALLEGNMHRWDSVVYSELVKSGEVLLAKQDLVVKSYIKNKIKTIQFLGYKVGITNSSDLASEIGNGIYEDPTLAVDFGIVYCITPRDTVLYSLRSKGDMDVAKIGEKFGGGGHKNASGFQTDIETLGRILKGEV